MVVAGAPRLQNTGVPAGTVLTPYTGPCTITVANTVIDSKIVTCDFGDRGDGGGDPTFDVSSVYIQDSEGANTSFRVEDAFVDGSPDGSWA